ncbi:HD domain-containing protein [Actinomadura fulvescens]|uniref:HD/PDEase domain-containing protein n=1 Tax=Actinomadura fulvescens TaxID=46160 RepID=A0ABN3Q3L7_9ACTN
MDATLAPLIERLRDRFSEDELRQVERAHAAAAFWHEGQYRLSGDPYITHVVQVAILAAEAGSDHRMVCAALLHDVLQDTDMGTAELRARFGDEICYLVEELTRHSSARTEPVDERVLLLRLLDRLHNMRTLQYLPAEKQLARSVHTLERLVPVARRSCPAWVAVELETLARSRLRPGLGFLVVQAASVILPAGARRRYLNEWRAELAALPQGRRTYLAELFLALPALAWVLWRPAAVRVLAVPFRTPLRPWLLTSPLLVWLTWQAARSSLAEALMFVLTVPPVLSAAFSRLRARLGLDPGSNGCQR